MTKTFFSLVIQEKKRIAAKSNSSTDGELFTDKERLRKVQVRLIWSSKEAYLKSKRGSLKVGKSLTRWQPGRSGNCIATYLAVRRDIMVITSGRIRCYIGT